MEAERKAIEVAARDQSKDSLGMRALQLLIQGRMFALLIILVIIFSIITPRFFTQSNLDTIARQMSLLLIVSLGASFCILMGMIDLSVGEVIALCGVITAHLIPTIGLWSVAVALVAGILFGLMNGLFVTGARLPSFLVTLGTLSVADGVLLTITKAYQTFDSKALIWMARDSFLGSFPNLAVWALILWAVLVFVQFRTRFGRYSYAIGGGEGVSKLSGIPTSRYKVMAFVLSGLMAAIAGVLLAGRIGAGTPQAGAGFMLDSIAAICIGGTALSGGVGGVHRTLLGALIITVLSAGLNMAQVGPNWQTMIKGFVLIIAVYFTMDRSRGLIIK